MHTETLASPLADDTTLVDSEDEQITTLRMLVEKLSTAEGKPISWKTLSKLVGMHSPPLSDHLEEHFADGCRIVRDLPARHSPLSRKRAKCTSFKFHLPHTLSGCTEDECSDVPLSGNTSRMARGGKPPSTIAPLRDITNNYDASMANYKKRKSIRSQTYLKRDQSAETGADKAEESEASCDDSDGDDRSALDTSKAGKVLEEAKVRSERKECHDVEGQVEDTQEGEKGRWLWHRRKEGRIPLSHIERVRRAETVKARCRARRLIRARQAAMQGNEGQATDADEVSGTTAEGKERVQTGRKPNRGERRAAALRRENAGTKPRPSLAELRARVGKGQPVGVQGMAGNQAHLPNTSSGRPPSTSAVVGPPTCEFTFTSRSMAAHRLVMMRAELDHLRKNLQEARKEIEVLQRQESEEAWSSGVGQQAETHNLPPLPEPLPSAATATNSPCDDTSGSAMTGETTGTKAAARPLTAPMASTKTTMGSSQTRVPLQGPAAAYAQSKSATTSPPPKSPVLLSRRKKANMANVHHISNHRPSRVLSDGTSRVLNTSQPSVTGGAGAGARLPGLDHPTTTSALFADEWMCVFCEYRLLYGEYPRMLGAIKSRKKLVAKKEEAQDRAHRATTIGGVSASKPRPQCTCGRAHARAKQAAATTEERQDEEAEEVLDYHDHDHDHHHHHHHHHHHSGGNDDFDIDASRDHNAKHNP